MSISNLGWSLIVTIVCAPVSALLALAVSLWRKRLQIPDMGTLFLPPLLFLLIAGRRPELQIGFAIPVWLIVVAVLSMYALAIKVCAFDLRTQRKPYDFKISVGLLLLGLVSAAVMASKIEPWYE